MKAILQYIPIAWRPWCRRYRRRLSILGILAGLYWGVQVLDFALDKLVFDLPAFQSGPLKMTRRHFQQPSENLFTWTNFNRFLENVTRNKPGILAQKWFYVLLIVLYIGLSVLVFLRITEPDEDEGKESEK